MRAQAPDDEPERGEQTGDHQAGAGARDAAAGGPISPPPAEARDRGVDAAEIGHRRRRDRITPHTSEEHGGHEQDRGRRHGCRDDTDGALAHQPGSPGQQQGDRRHVSRTPPGRRAPRGDLTRDEVGHRLGQVVVRPGRIVQRARRDSEHVSVLDPLGGEAETRRQLPAVTGQDMDASVDGAVEDGHAARQLGSEIGDAHRGGQSQVDAARSRDHRDAHAPRPGASFRRRTSGRHARPPPGTRRWPPRPGARCAPTGRACR